MMQVYGPREAIINKPQLNILTIIEGRGQSITTIFVKYCRRVKCDVFRPLYKVILHFKIVKENNPYMEFIQHISFYVVEIPTT
jgi:hypothetical protein